MRVYFILLVFLGHFAIAQQLTPDGMEKISVSNELTQIENFEKIYTYIQNYVVNDNIEVIEVDRPQMIKLEGFQNNVACYINRTMGNKTCFELQFTMVVKAKDNGYVIEVIELNAENENHPNKSYSSWFDENGNAYSALSSCVDATTEYFLSFKTDFNDFIETGDYW